MILSISHEAIANSCEDSFAVAEQNDLIILCCADGCGGAGSRRLVKHNNQTAARIAAQTAVQAYMKAVSSLKRLPATEEENTLFIKYISTRLRTALKDADEQPLGRSRITGTLQRNMPTTFCSAIISKKGQVFFLWCGDSRGYIFDSYGLHQCTSDDITGCSDSLQSLYKDVPLSNMLSSDTEFTLHSSFFTIPPDSLVLLMTDGIYNAFPTPMECEFFLLETIHGTKSPNAWRNKLQKRVTSYAQDDATLLIWGKETQNWSSYIQKTDEYKKGFQKEMITPLRRRHMDLGYAVKLWDIYRKSYEWQEEPHSWQKK